MATSKRIRAATRPAVLIPLFAALSMALVAGCGGGASVPPTSEAAAPNRIPVEVAEVERRNIAASYSNTASLEPLAEAQVVARISGVALAVLVEEGQQVRAGQTLVRLDPDRARLNVAQSEAQVRKLENSFQRAQQLNERQLISASEHDQLRYDLENARAVWRLAQLELSYTSVEAPISGVIASRSIKTGNFVQINTPILRIVDNSRLEATLNVPERELATMVPGLPVFMQVDALPGRVFEGAVDRVAPVVDSGSGTFRVITAFAGGNELRPGMFGRLRIDFDERADTLVIPRAALLDDESRPSVYAVREGVTFRTEIVPGYVDGDYIEVREGLMPGDLVVTAGKNSVREGSLVNAVNRPDTEPAEAVTPVAAHTGARQ